MFKLNVSKKNKWEKEERGSAKERKREREKAKEEEKVFIVKRINAIYFEVT